MSEGTPPKFNIDIQYDAIFEAGDTFAKPSFEDVVAGGRRTLVLLIAWQSCTQILVELFDCRIETSLTE